MTEILLNYGDGPRAIYEDIKQRIIAGEIAGGSELKIMSLASELGVSIVPVREAIRMLAAEDLIVLRSRRSPIVAKVDGHDLVEINFIRGVLEPLVVEDAVPNHSPASLSECESLHERERGCADLWEKVELNRKFHTSLLAPSGLARTQSIITDQYVGLARITHYLVMNQADLIDAHHDEHEIILTEVKRGNAKRAAQLMGAHIERATVRARSLFSGAESDGRPP